MCMGLKRESKPDLIANPLRLPARLERLKPPLVDPIFAPLDAVLGTTTTPYREDLKFVTRDT
jgi:hypothetical protein